MRKTLIIIWVFLWLFKLYFHAEAQIGKERIIEGEPPQWAKKIPEDKKFKYFVGFASDTNSLERGKNLAYIDALKQLIRSLGIIYEFKESYSIDEFLNQEIRGIPVYTLVREAEIKEIAWQKKEIVTWTLSPLEELEEVEIKYDVWVLIRYPREEWYRQRHYIIR